MADVLETHRILLRELLADEPDDLTFGNGQFFTVVMGSERVVCLPRTQGGGWRLAKRRAVLSALARIDLGVRTPEPIDVGSTGTVDPPPFLVLTRIPGERLNPEILRDAALAEVVARQYAGFLAALASAAGDPAVRASLPTVSADRWRRFANEVRASLFGLMSEAGRARAEGELSAVAALPHLTETLIHGDLGSPNVLWEQHQGLPYLCGVIDWDEVKFGDLAEDLAAIGASNGRAFLDRVLKAGNWYDEKLVERIETIRGSFALQQALAAHRDRDEEELADGLAAYT